MIESIALLQLLVRYRWLYKHVGRIPSLQFSIFPTLCWRSIWSSSRCKCDESQNYRTSIGYKYWAPDSFPHLRVSKWEINSASDCRNTLRNSIDFCITLLQALLWKQNLELWVWGTSWELGRVTGGSWKKSPEKITWIPASPVNAEVLQVAWDRNALAREYMSYTNHNMCHVSSSKRGKKYITNIEKMGT